MPPKDSKAGSGFAAARAQLAASAKAANATSPAGKGLPPNAKKRPLASFDEDLLDKPMAPPVLSDDMKALAARVEVSLSSELVERLEAEEELVSATIEVLRTLFCGARTICASLVSPMRTTGSLGGGLALVHVDVTSASDGLPDLAPCLVKLSLIHISEPTRPY